MSCSIFHPFIIYNQAARDLCPALHDTVFFSLDFKYLVYLDGISGGYQEDILEQFEKSKMATNMAAIINKKLNTLIEGPKGGGGGGLCTVLRRK